MQNNNFLSRVTITNKNIVFECYLKNNKYVIIEQSPKKLKKNKSSFELVHHSVKKSSSETLFQEYDII